MLCIEYTIWENLKKHVVYANEMNWWNKNNTDSYTIDFNNNRIFNERRGQQ